MHSRQSIGNISDILHARFAPCERVVTRICQPLSEIAPVGEFHRDHPQIETLILAAVGIENRKHMTVPSEALAAVGFLPHACLEFRGDFRLQVYDLESNVVCPKCIMSFVHVSTTAASHMADDCEAIKPRLGGEDWSRARLRRRRQKPIIA